MRFKGQRAVLATAIPYVLWSSSLKHLNVNVATSFKLFIPVFATLYSLMFLRETFTGWMLVGLILTSIGIYLVQREEEKKQSDKLSA